ncbi:MAG: DUF2887 domain-containing protein [Coleofasciculaceae cyanobacterium SM2_3_26]|nr:DUF2887 domain-containing protein [Coleofasciculaceae cyanobacterium SM2_3_26]
MRRDTIFYTLFQQSPTLLFELLIDNPDHCQRSQCPGSGAIATGQAATGSPTRSRKAPHNGNDNGDNSV